MKLTKSSSIFLDLIRGISAQLVLIGHLCSFNNIFGLQQHENRFLIQLLGVVVFFILSGFLIGYSVDNKGEKERYTFRHFFIDRFSRIFIAYIPALFLIVLLDLAAHAISGTTAYADAQNIKTFIGNVLMLQDFPFQHAISKFFPVHLTSYGSGRPLWTVATEWWIYLFFGFIYFKKITYKNFIFLLPLSIVPLYNVVGGGNGLSILWFLSLFGFYLLKKNTIKKNYLPVVVVLILASIVSLLFNNYNVYNLTFSIPLMMAIFVLLAHLQIKPVPGYFLSKTGKFSATLAAYSFSLYLLHYSIIEFARSFNFSLNPFANAILLFIVCNMAAWGFAKLTEYKYHRFRTYLTEKFL